MQRLDMLQDKKLTLSAACTNASAALVGWYVDATNVTVTVDLELQCSSIGLNVAGGGTAATDVTSATNFKFKAYLGV